jgi:hypothetical protein
MEKALQGNGVILQCFSLDRTGEWYGTDKMGNYKNERKRA